MKRLILAAAISLGSMSVFAADVAMSVTVGDPGFYGRLDIGGYPHPPVIYRQPIVIERVSVSRPPVYLRVPPGHAKHWRRHCREYDACGERVLFVQDNWYSREYAPHYREGHGGHQFERRDGMREGRRDGMREGRRYAPREEHRGGSDNDARGDNRGHGRDR